MKQIRLITIARSILAAVSVIVLASCGGGKDQTPDGGQSVTLKWLAPGNYTNGETISELSGYYIYINDGTGYVKVATITDPATTTYVTAKLAPGDYSFAVAAFDSSENQSSYSNEATFTVGL